MAFFNGRDMFGETCHNLQPEKVSVQQVNGSLEPVLYGELQCVCLEVFLNGDRRSGMYS